MASALGSVTACTTTLSSSARIQKSTLFSDPHQRPQHSFPSNCSSTFFSTAFLSHRPLLMPSPLRCPRCSLTAVEAEVAPQLMELQAPEPVERQIEAASASFDRKGEHIFAVVMIGSRQYIVIPGRFLYTQRLKGANVNDKVLLNKVLFVGTETKAYIGKPIVKAYIGKPIVTNAVVHAVVEEQGLDKKLIIFKFKKRKRYQRTRGHRQPRTRIRITDISGYEDYPASTLPEE